MMWLDLSIYKMVQFYHILHIVLIIVNSYVFFYYCELICIFRIELCLLNGPDDVLPPGVFKIYDFILEWVPGCKMGCLLVSLLFWLKIGHSNAIKNHFFEQLPSWMKIDQNHTNDNANTENRMKSHYIKRGSFWLCSFLCTTLSNILANNQWTWWIGDLLLRVSYYTPTWIPKDIRIIKSIAYYNHHCRRNYFIIGTSKKCYLHSDIISHPQFVVPLNLDCGISCQLGYCHLGNF